MSQESQVDRVITLLKANPMNRFTARQIAEAIVEQYADYYANKRRNPRFTTDKSFIAQIVAEIGSQKDRIVKTDPHIFLQDKPRPRLYWYNPEKAVDDLDEGFNDDPEQEYDDELDSPDIAPTLEVHGIQERDLYPILIEYLRSEYTLYCMRIDEKRSKNRRGKGGNEWLHPDIVAMQPVDKEWHDLVRSCVQHGDGQSVRLWSFEVKLELSRSNVRRSFFQAVSNSSWANEGYLVATSISSNEVEKELRMLSALHGIGVILLNPENPTESEMVLPATPRSEIDWQSVNRILTENEDFKDYIELVSTYYQTRRVRNRDWNKTQ